MVPVKLLEHEILDKRDLEINEENSLMVPKLSVWNKAQRSNVKIFFFVRNCDKLFAHAIPSMSKSTTDAS